MKLGRGIWDILHFIFHRSSWERKLEKEIHTEVKQEMELKINWQNELLNDRFRRRIDSAAEERYAFWLFNDGKIFIPMRRGAIEVATNNLEVFPESFEVYVERKFKELKNERHTEEEQIRIEYDNAERAFPGWIGSFEEYVANKKLKETEFHLKPNNYGKYVTKEDKIW